ncbi:MAG: glycosyltransferase family 2 protein [Planctomycetaceae bacterium]
MATAPQVAVVVPVHNKIQLTARFLESFREIDYPNYRVVITDDGSTDGTAQVLADRFPEVVVLAGDGNLWWSGGTNRGVEYALREKFDYVLTINNDVQVAADFLTRLVETAEAHPRSVIGSLICQMDEPEKVWAAGGYMDWEHDVLFQLHHWGESRESVIAAQSDPKPVDILTGCGTLIPAACFREVGTYDARWFPQYHADSEFVLRAGKAGYQALVALHAIIWNDCGNSSLVDSMLSPRSVFYWRPHYAIRHRYSTRPFAATRHLAEASWLRQRRVAAAAVRKLAGAKRRVVSRLAG